MSKDTPNKQKNIDDVLLSIDSLLDTATDIQLGDSDASPAEPTSKTTASSDQKTGEVKAKKTQKTKSDASEKSAQNKPHNKLKANSTDNQPASQSKSVPAQKKAQSEALKTPAKADEAAPQDQTGSVKHSAKIKQPTADKKSITLEEHSAIVQKPSNKEPLGNINMGDDPSGSLNFTTVDDDLSQVMRELPTLEDIVTAEDLALIGSGKEPPKKILTEAFKRLSLTDKLIEILENQLSDHNITKLEYKYLHELFNELIDKENDKN